MGQLVHRPEGDDGFAADSTPGVSRAERMDFGCLYEVGDFDGLWPRTRVVRFGVAAL